MENLKAKTGKREMKVRRPVLVVCLAAAILLAVYLVVCAVASGTRSIYPNYRMNGVKIGGMSVENAAGELARELPGKKIDLYLDSKDGEPAASITYEELGITSETNFQPVAQSAYDETHSGGFLGSGWRYLCCLMGREGSGFSAVEADSAQFDREIASLSQQLAVDPVDSAWELKDDTVEITKSRDGYLVSEDALSDAFHETLASPDGDSVVVETTVVPAQTLTLEEIHDAAASEVKNAGYDSATGKITPEQAGAEFDVDQAQKLLDSAEDGETITISATIEQPNVTAEELKGVLFRDVLGTATTHVGGSSARISNVKLASSSVNGTVLNSGDVFSYNGTVGRRTESKGYQAAPAYVQGETVDEIGGGVCQPSSTLYLACLNSNLQIVERSAHRYVPVYIAKGMDATVSWDGPDYRFKNDTDYPIKIVATYSGGYLTMKLLGTKTDHIHVKMTNKVLSTTDYQVVHQDDSTLPAGTSKVKTTPYTGYKVETYRNLYDGDGNLISSKLEDVSDYKVRNEIILDGPKKAASPAASSESGTETSGEETGIPAETPQTQEPVETEPSTPAA